MYGPAFGTKVGEYEKTLSVGFAEVCDDGSIVGVKEGSIVGVKEDSSVGVKEGSRVGSMLG